MKLLSATFALFSLLLFSPGANALFGKKDQKWALKCPKKYKLVKVKKNQYTCQSKKTKKGGKDKQSNAKCKFGQKYNAVKGQDTCGKKRKKAFCKSSRDTVKYVKDVGTVKRGPNKGKKYRDACVESKGQLHKYKAPKLKKVK